LALGMKEQFNDWGGCGRISVMYKSPPYLQGVGEDLSERDKKRKPRRTLDKASPLIR